MRTSCGGCSNESWRGGVTGVVDVANVVGSPPNRLVAPPRRPLADLHPTPPTLAGRAAAAPPARRAGPNPAVQGEPRPTGSSGADLRPPATTTPARRSM